MEEKIHTYESEEISVKFDSKRCIHSAECLKGLSEVFDTDKKPWVQPENASPEEIKKTIHNCPTGALHYNGSEEEKPARTNTITIAPDGPLYVRGDIEIQDADGETIKEDTRVALCRCGESDNKPFCDNSHKEVDFTAPASFDDSKLRPTSNEEESEDKLLIRLMDNGPFLIEGTYEVFSIGAQPVNSTKNVALCRCGHSGTKPFCDGTHKEVGFISD